MKEKKNNDGPDGTPTKERIQPGSHVIQVSGGDPIQGIGRHQHLVTEITAEIDITTILGRVAIDIIETMIDIPARIGDQDITAEISPQHIEIVTEVQVIIAARENPDVMVERAHPDIAAGRIRDIAVRKGRDITAVRDQDITAVTMNKTNVEVARGVPVEVEMTRGMKYQDIRRDLTATKDITIPDMEKQIGRTQKAEEGTEARAETQKTEKNSSGSGSADESTGT